MRANACDEPTTEAKQPNPVAPPDSAGAGTQKDSNCGVDNDLQSRESIPIPRNLLAAGEKQVARLNAFKEGELNMKDLARRFSKVSEVMVPFGSNNIGTFSFGPDLWAINEDDSRVVPASRMLIGNLKLPVTPMLKTMFSPFDFQVENWINGMPAVDQVFTPGASSTNLLCCAMGKQFALWSGGIRYKIQPQSNRLTGVNWCASYLMDENEFLPTYEGREAFGVFTAYPSHVGNFSQNACIEVECPFYSVYNQCVQSTQSLSDPNAKGNGLLNISFAADPLSNNLPVLTKNTVIYDPFTNTSATWAEGTPYLKLHVYAAGGDDIHYGYLVSPPDTFSGDTIVAPPSEALNSERSRHQLQAYRRCMVAAAKAFGIQNAQEAEFC